MLGNGSELSSAYLFRAQEKKTKPSAPTIVLWLVIKLDFGCVPNFSTN